MEIIPIESGPVYTLGYLAYDSNTMDALVIDVPLDSSDWFISTIEKLNLNLRGILLTHSHWDHTAEAPALKNRFDCEVLIHKEDEYRILAPNANTIWTLPFQLESLQADKYLEDGADISLGSLKFKIIHTPGHTEGSVCIVFEDDKLIFTGDTLFNQSIGRTDLPGGDSEKLMNSIFNKLMILDDNYLVYSGHGEVSDIGSERRYNPFIKNWKQT